MKNTKKHVDVSRLFIYYNARMIEGQKEYQMVDKGAFIAKAIESLAEYGCCKEKSFPYDAANKNRKPPTHCYDEAGNYRTQTSMRVDVDLNEMKACLAEGYPFAFGINLCKSSYEAKTNGGRIPTPTEAEFRTQQIGGHAMLAVGYSDTSECFIVRNSYGPEWVCALLQNNCQCYFAFLG